MFARTAVSRGARQAAFRGFSTSQGVCGAAIRAGVLLQRDPIITQRASKFEEATDRYFDWLQFISADRFPRDFFFKKGSTAESKWMELEDGRNAEWYFDEASKPQLKSVKKIVKEDEDVVEKSEAVRSIEVSPRETEADATGDQQSLERKLDRTLYLVVKSSAGEWTLPQGEIKSEELLHEAARRNLKELCGGRMSVWMVGNGPVGHHQTDQACTFFIKGHILSGQAQAGVELASEFKWITREEIEKTVSAEYWRAVKDMLSTI